MSLRVSNRPRRQREVFQRTSVKNSYFQRPFKGEDYEPKALIDIDCFADRIQESVSEPYFVMIGRRVVGQGAEIKPATHGLSFQ